MRSEEPETSAAQTSKSAKVIGLDQRQLLTRHVAGEPGAFAELVSLYRRPVYSYLVRCGVHEGARDDVFQEIFLTVHRQSHRFDERLPLNPWVFTIVANTVRDHFRKLRSRAEDSEAKQETLAATSPSPQELAVGQETVRSIQQEIEQLPLEQRECILLCCVQGMEQKEAAKVLGMPVNTVKTNIRRGRMALARALGALKAKATREEMA